MTASVVSAADPAHRGATLALYSMVGFSTGFISPALFGVVLDLAGGRGEVIAWGLAFASLGLVSVLGAIPARMIPVKRETSWIVLAVRHSRWFSPRPGGSKSPFWPPIWELRSPSVIHRHREAACYAGLPAAG
jgi:MFS family permease